MKSYSGKAIDLRANFVHEREERRRLRQAHDRGDHHNAEVWPVEGCPGCNEEMEEQMGITYADLPPSGSTVEP